MYIFTLSHGKAAAVVSDTTRIPILIFPQKMQSNACRYYFVGCVTVCGLEVRFESGAEA